MNIAGYGRIFSHDEFVGSLTFDFANSYWSA